MAVEVEYVAHHGVAPVPVLPLETSGGCFPGELQLLLPGAC